MRKALLQHWPEYLMEATELGLFMIAACVFAALLEHPSSPVPRAIASPFARRALMGIAMGLTAIAIVHTPFGQRSGAHFNPSVTLSFLRLGKIEPWDAFFYVAFQFAGGLAGVGVAAALLGPIVADPSVNYVATLPGPRGPALAFAAEAAISFVLMLTILITSNAKPLARFTPFFAGALVATWITFEAPLSGMSMNPARTLASAVPARAWSAVWIYFTAPLLGMLAATEIFVGWHGAQHVICAKLHHHNGKRCIFRCNYHLLGSQP